MSNNAKTTIKDDFISYLKQGNTPDRIVNFISTKNAYILTQLGIHNDELPSDLIAEIMDFYDFFMQHYMTEDVADALYDNWPVDPPLLFRCAYAIEHMMDVEDAIDYIETCDQNTIAVVEKFCHSVMSEAYDMSFNFFFDNDTTNIDVFAEDDYRDDDILLLKSNVAKALNNGAFVFCHMFKKGKEYLFMYSMDNQVITCVTDKDAEQIYSTVPEEIKKDIIFCCKYID